MANETRLIDAYTLAEEIESLQITVAGKPAKWNDARHSVLRLIAEQADVDAPAVQRWIPVTDRLPEIPDGWAENPEPVLYMMKSTKTIYAGYYGEGGVYRDKYFRQYADGHEGVDARDVLCWMYQHDLPEPPKEG